MDRVGYGGVSMNKPIGPCGLYLILMTIALFALTVGPIGILIAILLFIGVIYALGKYSDKKFIEEYERTKPQREAEIREREEQKKKKLQKEAEEKFKDMYPKRRKQLVLSLQFESFRSPDFPKTEELYELASHLNDYECWKIAFKKYPLRDFEGSASLEERNKMLRYEKGHPQAEYQFFQKHDKLLRYLGYYDDDFTYTEPPEEQLEKYGHIII